MGESEDKPMSSNWTHDGRRPTLISRVQASKLNKFCPAGTSRVFRQVGRQYLRKKSEKLKENLVKNAVTFAQLSLHNDKVSQLHAAVWVNCHSTWCTCSNLPSVTTMRLLLHFPFPPQALAPAAKTPALQNLYSIDQFLCVFPGGAVSSWHCTDSIQKVLDFIQADFVQALWQRVLFWVCTKLAVPLPRDRTF